jgi:long-subunit fatty acid transport protein
MSTRLKIIVRTIIVTILIVTNTGIAQDTYGLFAAFNRYNSGSQAAMGTSLLSSGSSTVIFLNPAGMQFLETSQIAFTYLKLEPSLDQRHMSYAATYRFGKSFSLGLGGVTYLVDDIEGYNVNAEYTGTMDLNENLYVLSFATSIISPFHIGLNIRAANQSIHGDDPVDGTAYALDYGFVYQQNDWFLLSMSTQSPFKMNEGERSLPRLRTSIELDLPFFKKSQGAALQLSLSTQTEYGHWTTGVLGTHLQYPFTKSIIGYANVRTPSVLLIENKTIDTDLGYYTLEQWGVSGGIQLAIMNNFMLKLEMTYLNEKYFNQQITTIELMR